MYTDNEIREPFNECYAGLCNRRRGDEVACNEELLSSACRGDRTARQRLYAQCLPLLQRWARARLPGHVQNINDSDDLVQITLLRALNRLDDFAHGGYQGFLAYLRQILLNEIRSELRTQARRGEHIEYDDSLAQEGDPVVEQMLGYERECALADALGKLNRRQQQHLAMRVESGMTFREIATQVGGSTDGARMTVTRALRSMSEYLSLAAV
jgi:RNA polymerase sigma-70 factor (ECF subfamily)